MANENPYAAPSADEPPQFVRIGKSFSYKNTVQSKGIIFQGAIFASSDGLFISHDKHSWESAATATAVFGLLGAAIHHFMTRNKKFEYPFPALPVDELPASIRDRMAEHKFKEKSVVSIIPKADIQGYSSGIIQGKKFLIGEIELVLVAPVKKGLKFLPELGYEVL